MPAAEIARRGGAVRVRTVTLASGRKIKVYVVRDAGPRGGRTVAAIQEGEPHRGTQRRTT